MVDAVCCSYMSVRNTVSDAVCQMHSDKDLWDVVCLSVRSAENHFCEILSCVGQLYTIYSLDFFCIKLHCQTLRSIDTEGEADE